jgi:formylglycine-generating enzyme required for sulfatase activity
MREQSPLSGGDPLVPAARGVLDAQPDAFEPELAAYVTAQLRAIDEEQRRQRRRRWLLLGAAAVTAVAVSFGGLALQARADRQQRIAEAEGAVAALERAGSDQIAAAAAAATLPTIAVHSEPLLRAALSRADEADDRAKKLRAAVGLARLPAPGEQAWTCLAESLLVSEPADLAVIRTALAPQAAGFREMFWDRGRGHVRGERLRAAAALAAYDPADQRWRDIATAVAGDLVTVPAVHLASWLAAFRDVRGVLVPAIVPIFADPRRREVERSLAADILADYAADDPAVLADLTMTAEPVQFPAIARQVEAQFARVAPLLEAEIARSLPEDLPAADAERERLGIRQAKAAAVLVRFGRSERVWPLFVHVSDPRVRSYLVHFVAPFGVSPEPLAERLAVEPDVSVRRALVIAIGEIAGAEVARAADLAVFREAMLPKLRSFHETDPDPGLHAATAWTLRKFGDDEWLAARQEAWREQAATAGQPRLKAILQEFAGDGPRPPRWYVNGQGQSLVAVPGPVEFLMGSPDSEAGRSNDETIHRRRIRRSFAIAATPVTLGESERLVGRGEYGKEIAEALGPRFSRSSDLPVVGLNWFMAATYCNALSEAEGIPESDWVYEQDEQGTIRLTEGWMDRSGYRLPTEGEWEYASRAGAATSRFFGETVALVQSHAWYNENSALDGNLAPWPVGLKKPNDLGLFDPLGNVWNWCHGVYEQYPPAAHGGVVEDEEGERDISREVRRVLRGGSFGNDASYVRSGTRVIDVPTTRFNAYGLRVARTLPPVSLPPVPNGRNADEDVTASRGPE